jgi:hypothetical protein
MQRHMTLPAEIGGIGGFGQLATVDERGIKQRLLQRWPDEPGGKLRPPPIDWDRWHRENPKPGASKQNSRLKREIEARRARKRFRISAATSL